MTRLVPFTPDHLPAAHALGAVEGWPHRVEDWAFILSHAKGQVAVAQGEVAGTIMMAPFGPVATLSMVLVGRAYRGRGLGRRLMEAAMDMAGDRELRLVATPEGRPLYERLGLAATGTILQHQGIARAADPELPVSEGPADYTLDLVATGAERGALLAGIADTGTVLRAPGGFALIRDFGKGRTVGPVIAPDLAAAGALVSAAATREAGRFLRLDTDDAALAEHAASLGLAQVDTGTSMVRDPRPCAAGPVRRYGLVSQDFG